MRVHYSRGCRCSCGHPRRYPGLPEGRHARAGRCRLTVPLFGLELHVVPMAPRPCARVWHLCASEEPLVCDGISSFGRWTTWRQQDAADASESHMPPERCKLSREENERHVDSSVAKRGLGTADGLAKQSGACLYSPQGRETRSCGRFLTSSNEASFGRKTARKAFAAELKFS